MTFHMQNTLWMIFMLFCAYQASAQETSKSLEVLERIRVEYNLPGLAAGVVGGGRSLKAQAVGVRKDGDLAETTVHDDFHLGSNGKAMTATLLAIFIEKGVFSWNTTLWEALPELRGSMHKAHQDTTLALLTAHRTGLPMQLQDMPVSNKTLLRSLHAWEGTVGREEVMAFILPQSPIRTPNTTFIYSNLNYMIAGYIIDKHVGPWDITIRERLWDPLNMTKCGFGPSPQSDLTAVDNPWPHSQYGSTLMPVTPDKFSDIAPHFGPARTVHCSPLSYSKFLAVHLDGFVGRETVILRAESFVPLHTAYLATDEQYTPGGWFKSRADWRVNGSWLSHSGTNTLNYATTILAPGRDEAYMAFTNVGGSAGREALSDIMVDFFDRKLELTQAILSDPTSSPSPNRTPSSSSSPTSSQSPNTTSSPSSSPTSSPAPNPTSSSSAQPVLGLYFGATMVELLSGVLCICQLMS